MAEHIVVLGGERVTSLARVLSEKLGYEVRHCPNWQKASAADMPDLVILDAKETGMIQQLRQIRDRHASLPVMALIDLLDHRQEGECLRAGADDVLSKPFTLVRLHASIIRLLRIRRLEREVELLRD